MLDPYEVLGVSRDTSREEVRAARRALVKTLHPDLHGGEPAASRFAAERRLAGINAAYDALVAERAVALARTPGGSGAPQWLAASFVVGLFRPAAFEALMVAAGDVGDVTDVDEPFAMHLHVEGPPTGFCHLELFPEAGASLVVAESDLVDVGAVCSVLAEALRALGVSAHLLS